MSRPKSADKITISWHIDDVKEIRPDLTVSECREVLRLAKRFHDAAVGISWEVLKVHAGHLRPRD